MDRAEFQRNYEFMKKELNRYNEEKQRKHDVRKANAKSIRDQIREREKLRSMKKREFRVAGDSVQRDTMSHISNLRSIKQHKIKELMQMGVPERYISELHHHDPLKA